MPPVFPLFSPSASPRVYGLPPGVDFPAALLKGLRERLRGQPPEAMARIQLVVNSQRMGRRLEQLLHSATPCLLPAIDLVTTYHGNAPQALMLPPVIPDLRRRLQLGQLVGKLLDQQPDLAPRTCRYHLAASLARLMDELQGEGVDPQAIKDLDVGELSGHWQRSQAFLNLVQEYLHTIGGLDAQARQRQAIESLILHWQSHPPGQPVIVAGSTGSQGGTQLLMQAVARLDQGAVVLPGFDFDLPAVVWPQLDQTRSADDHPQQRFHHLLQALRMDPQAVQPWVEIQPAAPARNRLVSLALRPAPVTDAWLAEGPSLGRLDTATEGLTLLEAPDLRQEALTIALRLRHALEEGRKAAMMTPDRRLARHVSAALDRWGIVADDSAGLPLQLSPPGRFLRQAAQLMTRPLTTGRLLSLLQHPLCHSVSRRTTHLRHSRALELWLRKKGHSLPGTTVLQAFARRSRQQTPDHSPTPTEADWIHWLTTCLSGLPESPEDEQPLREWIRRLQEVALRLAAGCDANADGTDHDNNPLWKEEAGRTVRQVVAALEQEAAEGGSMDGLVFVELFQSLLSGKAVRNPDFQAARVSVWSPWEARSHDAQLLVLGGLNEGCWPETLAPDPWLNRPMRRQAGLPLPEQKLGLAAHDLQQAVAAPQVWLSRSTRSNDGETVPCRWLNRLTNLLRGLPEQGGRQCLEDMSQRGRQWLNWAQELDAPTTGLAAAARPCPAPPVAARPRKLGVTEIRTLVKDPYSIYARHVLRLVPLNPLEQTPDALLRGVAIHRVMENFLRAIQEDPTALASHRRHRTRATFLHIAEDTLREAVPWPVVQRLWLARLDRLADWFLNTEVERQRQGQPFAFEVRGETLLDLHPEGGQSFPFVLSAVADRIDKASAGWLIYDYKTGAIPSPKEQEKADKQLLLEMIMVEKGAFQGISPGPAQGGTFIGLGSNPVEKPLTLESGGRDQVLTQTLGELHTLLCTYLNPGTGYQSRRLLPMDTAAPGPYDQLARFGEWDSATPAHPRKIS